MIRDVRPDDVGISVSYPLPDTRFFQIVNSQSNWRDSADLAMTYAGAFPTEFYRALADALHAEVRGESPGASEIKAAWDKVEALRCACC
jgi:anaerobic magnesium-protoporphyrin IX monomethyl ester cyclase